MKVKLRRGPFTFALMALVFCAGIATLLNRFVPEKSASVSGSLVSADCQNWEPQSKFKAPAKAPHGLFFKDAHQITQLNANSQSNLTVILPSVESQEAKEFSYSMLGTDYLLVISSHSFGLQDLQDDPVGSGVAGLNTATMRFSQGAAQGAWTVVFDDPNKLTLSAFIRDLGTVTCKADGCFFAIKDHVQPLPLKDQLDTLAELKNRKYFNEKLQPLRDACSDIKEAPLRSQMIATVADFRFTCMIGNLEEVANISVADLVCQALEKTIYPIIENLKN